LIKIFFSNFKGNDHNVANTDVFNDKELKQLDFEKHYIEIEVKEDGYCIVRILKEYETIVIQNHIGDLDNLKLLLNTINNTKYEKLIELVKNYMGLIESSFEYLLKNQTEKIKSVDYGLFETVRFLI
jgi:predicted transposase